MAESERVRNEYVKLVSAPNYDARKRAKSTEFLYKNYLKAYQDAQTHLIHLNKVTIPLRNLRADPHKIPDKMGPWYHIFALFTIDALSNGQSLMALYGEHWAKYFKAFSKEGGYNKEKETIDYAFLSKVGTCGTQINGNGTAAKPALAEDILSKGFIICPDIGWPLFPKSLLPDNGKVNEWPVQYRARCSYYNPKAAEKYGLSLNVGGYSIDVYWGKRNSGCFNQKLSEVIYKSPDKNLIIFFGRDPYLMDGFMESIKPQVVNDLSYQLGPNLQPCIN